LHQVRKPLLHLSGRKHMHQLHSKLRGQSGQLPEVPPGLHFLRRRFNLHAVQQRLFPIRQFLFALSFDLQYVHFVASLFDVQSWLFFELSLFVPALSGSLFFLHVADRVFCMSERVLPERNELCGLQHGMHDVCVADVVRELCHRLLPERVQLSELSEQLQGVHRAEGLQQLPASELPQQWGLLPLRRQLHDLHGGRMHGLPARELPQQWGLLALRRQLQNLHGDCLHRLPARQLSQQRSLLALQQRLQHLHSHCMHSVHERVC
jgi:hypothetical protein